MMGGKKKRAVFSSDRNSLFVPDREGTMIFFFFLVVFYFQKKKVMVVAEQN